MTASVEEIRAFVATVDAGSFIGGSRAIGLTRSAVGKAIARTEKRLGTRLLNRTTRALSMTDEGKLYYDHCKRILHLLEETDAIIGGDRGTPSGLLRLTVPTAFGRLHVLPLLHRYMAKWPDLRVDVSFSDRVEELVDGGYDLAVRIGIGSPDSQMISRVVAHHVGIFCAAPSYLDLRGRPEKPDDLLSHDCVVFRSETRRHPWRFRDDDGSWASISGRVRLRLDSGEAIRDAAIAGVGIINLPSFLVQEALVDGRLEQVLSGHETESVPIQAVYSSKLYLPAKVRCLVDLMSTEWAETRRR
ncbi:LysR family transcriptional regulator [Stappia sp. BW2]|uniref:LysR family transcriptional regulator n=1 Tax=Stappia sp. BW2 TaxID=2592622 RepID=UPI0011DEB97A|nr:LysR family transcriptional regulator [Stappia sp. BW2]TYC65090.1 LysR family transcriptional regulator [Stappia sp. BW2]